MHQHPHNGILLDNREEQTVDNLQQCGTMLSEIRQHQKATHCRSAFIWHSGKGKPFKDEELKSGCPGLGVGEIWLQRVSIIRLLGDGMVL